MRSRLIPTGDADEGNAERCDTAAGDYDRGEEAKDNPSFFFIRWPEGKKMFI